MSGSKPVKWVTFLDAFPKVDTEYLQRTKSGGLATILTFSLMGLLFLSELYRYMSPPITQDFVVDRTIENRVNLHVDLVVATICEKLAVLVAEDTGNVKFINDVLSMDYQNFNDPRSKVAAQSQGWREKVREIDSSNHRVEGCHIYGDIVVNKSGGRLMIVPITSGMGPIGQLLSELDNSINFSHHIYNLSFGKDYPGMVNPLNGANQLAMKLHEHFTYFLSIIGTTYNDRIFTKQFIHTHQYTLTGLKGKEGFRDTINPGLFFKYSYDPLSVVITRDRIPFISFLIRLVGIVGGVYTCSGLIHSLARYLIRIIGPIRRKGSDRFDAGWSPVSSGPRPSIVKSIRLSTDDMSKGLLA